MATGSIDIKNADAHISRIPVNPRENNVRAVLFPLREKLIPAREHGVIFRYSFFVFPSFFISVIVVILTASTGETCIAIRTGFRIDSITVISITRAVMTANLIVFGQYQPPGISRYPAIPPLMMPRGMESNDSILPSLRTRHFICFWVMPITRSLPYSFTFPVTDI